jgi:tRNA(fMet)-specific endonuclease VapC
VNNQKNMNNEKNGHEFLLDTNACIKYIKGNSLSILQKLSALPRQQVVLCDIVKLELYYGAYKSASLKKNLAVLDKFFNEFVSLPFDDRAVIKCAQIRATLATKGTPIGPYDSQIAAIALVNNLVLVTHNTR